MTRLLAILVILIPFGCNKNADLQDVAINPAIDLSENLTFNAEQLGQFVYRHVKYYMATVDPYSFVAEEYRDEFKSKFESEVKAYETRNLNNEQHLDYLVEQGVYSIAQVDLMKKQHADLRTFLFNEHPNATTAWNWMLDQDKAVLENELLSDEEKGEILRINSITRHLMQHRLETYDASGHDNLGAKSSCDFWDRLFCYLGAVKDMLGLGDKIKAGSNAFGLIGAAIGAVTGAYRAITSCSASCNTSICGPFEGVSLAYNCYDTGDNLIFTGWGHGDISPSSIIFDYYKNDDWSSGSNFWSDVETDPTSLLPGTEITDHSVDEVGVRTSNLCSGIAKIANHGMWDLDDLGVPYGAVVGDDNIHVDQTNYQPTFTYWVAGPVTIADATLTWSIIPSGYPGYSATGSFTGGTTNQIVTINWDDTPGFVTLRCTAVSDCGTEYIDLRIHIYDY
ncbi:hypothetical protein [Flavilitoribacter nigricans]|uniref:hypothetical protein n=1 Tax=Flavilitoribacter nigricans TaxID=70997 RepID=UPI00117ACBD8|nr:hypothetical protein [Flavilitoribacter nigricans]